MHLTIALHNISIHVRVEREATWMAESYARPERQQTAWQGSTSDTSPEVIMWRPHGRGDGNQFANCSLKQYGRGHTHINQRGIYVDAVHAGVRGSRSHSCVRRRGGRFTVSIKTNRSITEIRSNRRIDVRTWTSIYRDNFSGRGVTRCRLTWSALWLENGRNPHQFRIFGVFCRFRL